MNTKQNLNTEAVYTIGVAAKKLGVSVHLLRVYEREGLILTERTPSGRRMYSDLEIEKARCIRQMIGEYGMNFAGLKRILALLPCWKIRGCDGNDKEKCNAIKSNNLPCWATEEKCAHPLPSCRDCIVYQSIIDCNEIKNIIYSSAG